MIGNVVLGPSMPPGLRAPGDVVIESWFRKTDTDVDSQVDQSLGPPHYAAIAGRAGTAIRGVVQTWVHLQEHRRSVCNSSAAGYPRSRSLM
jgi:hypothetical protein